MRIQIKNDHEIEFIANNPDERLSAYYRERMLEALKDEWISFVEEVSVAMRNMKAGEKLTIKSRPISITLEKCKEDADAKN